MHFSDLYMNYTGGVYYDTTNNTEIDHDISVVGYGVDKETGWKYWLIRNSWGTYWVRQKELKAVLLYLKIKVYKAVCVWNI